MTGTIEELDCRENHGITVTLLWSRSTSQLAVHVLDGAQGEEFELEVAPSEALEVFQHPYAYAASRRISYRDPLAVA